MRAALVLIIASACAMTETQQNTWVKPLDYYSIDANGARSLRYSRVSAYTEYGVSGLGAQTRIGDAYAAAQQAVPPVVDAIMFHAELPPGISIDGSSVRVDPRAEFEPIAQYEVEYWQEAAPTEPEILDDVHRLAKVTNADAIVVAVQRVGQGDSHVKRFVGFVLRRREIALAVPTGTKRKTAILDYRATGDDCPSADNVSATIAKRLGYVPWDPAASSTVHLDVLAVDREYTASIRIGNAAPRTLRGRTCRRVTDASISIAVIQLD